MVIKVLVKVGFKLTVPIEEGMRRTVEWFKQVYESNEYASG